ncbi:MAG: VCBS repeat-containing protein [Nitrospirae bacterium]|nr:VCBS repeat-containing protein [Nitrospirota bacterium]
MVKKLFLILLVILSLNSSGCTSVFKSYVSDSNLKKGKKLIEKRKYDEAETTVMKAIAYQPDNSKAWITLGDIFLSIEDYNSAENMYKEGIRRDKNAYDAYAGLWALELEETGYTEEVKVKVKKEIEGFIDNGEKKPERLMAAYKGLNFLHEYDKSAELARDIVDSGADKKTVGLLALDIFEELLREKDAVKRLAKIDEFMKTFSMSREHVYLENVMRLNIAAGELNDKELLYKYGEDWIRNDPDNRRANFIVAKNYVDSDIALDRAVDYLKKALTLIKEPDPADKPEFYPDAEWYKDLKKSESVYYDTLGWAYYKLGRYRDAERAYNMGEKYNDFNSSLYYHAGVLEEKEGKIEDALFSYINALKAGENDNAYQNLGNILETHYSIKEPFYKVFAGMEGLTTFTDVTEVAGLKGVNTQRVSWGDYNNDGYDDLLFNGYMLYKNNGDGTFKNVTQEAGIAYVTGANGGVWGDFDNDGNLDFYTFASGKDSTDRFWRNNGDGTFTDITKNAAQTPDPFPSEAAAWGDYDKDGFIDIYVANYEKPLFTTIERAMGTPDRLYHNNGDNTFEEVSTAAGIAPPENMCGRGVSWGDYDNDGDPDIYVSNYRLDSNFLWRNNTSPIHLPSPLPSPLRGEGIFSNVAEEAGAEGYEQEGMYGHSIGADWGDYNNDGNLDLFVSNLAHPRYIGFSDKSMLLENQGPPDYRFKDRFGSSGIRFEETTADPSFADYDNDGMLDLFFTSTYEGKKSFLYKGNGDGTFTDITWLAGVRVDNGWGNAFADFDNDGDLDLITASGTGNGVRLFRNDGNGNHYLQVKVVGSKSNRSGIGARVTVMRKSDCGKEMSLNEPLTKGHEEQRDKNVPPILNLLFTDRQSSPFVDGGSSLFMDRRGFPTPPEEGSSCANETMKQIREVQGGKGSGSQHSMIASFGFGRYDGVVDVEVTFPSGKVIRKSDVKTGQRLLVIE